MANAVKYGALGTFTTAIAGASSAPTLKNLANNGRKLGNAIDRTGSGNREQESLWELLCKFGSTPTTGGFVSLYFVKAADGTNYEYGDDSNDPPASAWVADFPVQLGTSAQRIVLEGIVLPNCPFKPLVINKTGQGMTNTDNENVLSYRLYDPNEVQ